MDSFCGPQTTTSSSKGPGLGNQQLRWFVLVRPWSSLPCLTAFFSALSSSQIFRALPSTPGKSWASPGLSTSKTSIQCAYSSEDTCVLQTPGPGAWISNCASMTSYLLRAWERGREGNMQSLGSGHSQFSSCKGHSSSFYAYFFQERADVPYLGWL